MSMVAATDPTMWLIARASGITAWAFATSTVVAGLTLTARPFGKSLKPAVVTQIHRTLSVATLIAVAVHMLSILLDTTLHTTWTALLVPGLIGYRRWWTGLGVIAAELMVLIHLSFYARRFIGVKAWRTFHFIAYLTWGATTVHGIAAGTDTQSTWMLAAYTGAVALVIGLTTWRILAGTGVQRARKEREARAAARASERAISARLQGTAHQ